MTAGSAQAGRLRSLAPDIAVLLALLAFAALLRLPDLATRGPWDTDQGEQMLAIRAIVNGQLTLLGAPTSTGGLHHGPVFYYIGALFAYPTGGDEPTAVAFGIALGGIATVGLTWWLVRAAGGGPVGAAVAAVLVAVSAQMVDASVRLWNPAFVAPGAALALAAALQARRGSPRWWAVAAIGFVIAAQSHVLGWVLAAPMAVLAVGDLRRRDRGTVRWLTVGVAIVAASFIPFLIHELTTDFSEIRGVLAARGGLGAVDAPPWPVRAVFVPFRVLSVPLVRDVLLWLPATTLAAGLVVGAAVLGSRRASRVSSEARMLGLGLALAIALLIVGAPWLSTVTPLYVDHYHLALDPLVFGLLGLAAGVLWRTLGGRVVVAVVVASVAAWNLLLVPLPPVNADGGWPAGLAAGQQVVEVNAGQPSAIVGSPRFKKTTAVDYPVTVLGSPPVDQALATRVTVLCDELFEEVVEAACQGPAEEARLAEVGITPGPLVTRFLAAPGRWISIYEIAGR